MDNKYVDIAEHLIEQRQTMKQSAFNAKVNKLTALLTNKIEEIQNEINRIEHKSSVISKKEETDVQNIGKEYQMLQLLTALANKYESQLRTSTSEQKRLQELNDFENVIKGKYAHQSLRLKKVKHHIAVKKKQLEDESRIDMPKRKARIAEEKEILIKYQNFIKAEKRLDFNLRISETENNIANIQQEIDRISNANVELKHELENKQNMKDVVANDISQFENTVNSNVQHINDTKEILEKENLQIAQNISNLKREISNLEKEAVELDSIYSFTINMKNTLDKGHKLAEIIQEQASLDLKTYCCYYILC
ncbi:hypothetical protein TVAG_100990 [Trichomonas vaginalis G3]|uniref:Uncharacterized protein n=1 Tax=Trichomonas vaginalis (strain ATCC PRA-98 / G3) TaxID=412133 RepID=A2DJI3_TRIV3|nr:hypothetical protein TVAGG3_1036270 [Trichomonas vaginalis G3]EAY19383.1 hypothetical protein TVAG_100990 [Trichomonas vaginalis G3]KAI5493223.1 hypothetical protein TVAGG3_1036270 [Trichomonas vaginalis G3]|eukprot:XP_001580369.1 hypothetical protein [Trichomonas vaginalis G3]